MTVLLTIGLVAASLTMPADAAKRKKKPKPLKRIERVVEVVYDHPGVGAAPLGGYPTGFPDSSEIPTTVDDKFLKIEVADASGQAVWGFISQGDLDGNGVNDDGYANFCGAHTEAIPVAQPGTPILGIYA